MSHMPRLLPPSSSLELGAGQGLSWDKHSAIPGKHHSRGGVGRAGNSQTAAKSNLVRVRKCLLPVHPPAQEPARRLPGSSPIGRGAREPRRRGGTGCLPATRLFFPGLDPSSVSHRRPGSLLPCWSQSPLQARKVLLWRRCDFGQQGKAPASPVTPATNTGLL